MSIKGVEIFEKEAKEKFKFLLRSGFVGPKVFHRNSVSEIAYRKDLYGLRVSFDVRDEMVSVYAFSSELRDPRYRSRNIETHIWGFLEHEVDGTISVKKCGVQGIEGEVQRNAELVSNYLPLIDQKIRGFLESISEKWEADIENRK